MTSNEHNKTNKNNNEGEKVFLFTFPPVPHTYNFSPFTIKLESYFRVNQIPYETVYTSKFSQRGTIPYVRLGNDVESGEEVSDSNVIIRRLKQMRGMDCDAHLSKEEISMCHAVTRMLEEHTAQLGFYYRYGLHFQEFYDALDIPVRMFHADESRKGKLMSDLWLKFQPAQTKKKTKCRGLSPRSTDEELWEFCNDDLRCLLDLLGTKDYFFGTKPSTLDCVVFGHLSQFMYIPMDFPQKRYIKEQCPNLVSFMERFRNDFWPDWEVKCQRAPNAKYVVGTDVDEEAQALKGLRLQRELLAFVSAVGLAVAAVWYRCL